jgi:ABC-type branched-subunit amino acid transport system substrate-binding protein
MKAYFNKINAAGGVYGRKIKLITADDQCTSGALATRAARQLLDQDQAFALLNTYCPVATSAITQSVLKGTDIVNLTQDGSGWVVPGPAPIPAKDGYAYFWSPNTATQAVDILGWAWTNVTNPTIHKIGVIEDDDLYGENCGYATKQFAAAHNLPAPVITQTTTTATDETVNVDQLKSHGVDTMVLCSFPGPAAAALAAAHSDGWAPHILAATLADLQLATIGSLPVAAYDQVYAIAPVTGFIPGTPQEAAFSKSLGFGTTVAAESALNGPGSAIMGEIMVHYLKAAGKNLTRASFLKALYGPKWQPDGMTVPMQILPGAHSEVTRSGIVVRYLNAHTEQQVAIVQPPTDVTLPGVG